MLRESLAVYKGHFVWTTLRVMPRGETRLAKKKKRKMMKKSKNCLKTDGLNCAVSAIKVKMNVKVRAAARVVYHLGTLDTLLRSLTRFIYKLREVFFSLFYPRRALSALLCAACLNSLSEAPIIHAIAGRAFITSICIA